MKLGGDVIIGLFVVILVFVIIIIIVFLVCEKSEATERKAKHAHWSKRSR